MRAPAIRRIYRKGVAWLAISTTLLALAYRLAGPAPLTFPNGWVQFSERIPWFVAGLLVVTLVLLSRRAQPWLRGVMKATVQIAVMAAIFGARVEANVSRQEVDESEASIRPFALRLLAAFWVAVALIRAATVYPSLAAPWPLIFNTIAVASVFGCLVWIRRGAAAVERQYPYQPPLNLLALRVFNSASLPDFLNLSHRWQWIGTRQLLDGPDSAGHKARDLLNYLEGRIARSIVKDEAELRRALGAFSTRPDRHLRFPVNSMQCGDATWKEAQLFEPGAMRAHGARGKKCFAAVASALFRCREADLSRGGARQVQMPGAGFRARIYRWFWAIGCSSNTLRDDLNQERATSGTLTFGAVTRAARVQIRRFCATQRAAGRSPSISA
jgi:hypothetical protein